MTMLDYHRSASGGEEASDAWDRLRYVESRLDKATATKAVAIREYLTYERLYRGAARTPNELVLETNDIGLATPTGTGHRLLMRAARACAELGQPQLQEYLHDDTRNHLAEVTGLDYETTEQLRRELRRDFNGRHPTGPHAPGQEQLYE